VPFGIGLEAEAAGPPRPYADGMPIEPRPPLLGRIRPGFWLTLDGVLAAGYAVVVWGLLARTTDSRVALWAAAALGSVAVALARRRPLTALPTALGMFWLCPLTGAAAGTLAFLALLPATVLLFHVAATCIIRTAIVALVVSMTAAAATALPHLDYRGGVLPFALTFCTAWTAGLAVGRRRRYTDDLQRYHEQLIQAEVDNARRGVTEERLRIARELHDVVAHSISVITVQAAYGHLVVEAQPAQAGAALGTIERTGRDTLVEMRRLLGVLRDDGPERRPSLVPAAGLADLDALMTQTGQAGVDVDLQITGRVRVLPPGTDLSAFRVIQEALTNVIRHADTQSARVAVDFGPTDLDIEIVDDGRGGTPSTGGHGLRGMRERVSLYNGRFTAGPRPDGGFRVVASLPIGHHTAGDGS
jgi:signal transduction histidine kinase